MRRVLKQKIKSKIIILILKVELSFVHMFIVTEK